MQFRLIGRIVRRRTMWASPLERTEESRLPKKAEAMKQPSNLGGRTGRKNGGGGRHVEGEKEGVVGGITNRAMQQYTNKPHPFTKGYRAMGALLTNCC